MGQAASSAQPTFSAVVDVGALDDGLGATYRHAEYKDALVSSFADDVVTLGDLFERAVRLFPGRPFLGRVSPERTMVLYQSYYAVARRVKLFGSGLVALGGGAFPQRMALVAATCPECVLCAEACNSYGATLVSLNERVDGTLLAAALDAVPCALMVVDAARATVLLDVLGRAKARTAQTVVLIGAVVDAPLALAASRAAVQLVTFDDVERAGLTQPVMPTRRNDADAIALVTFSSGSTGAPRAVSLSHRNFMAALTGAYVGLWRGVSHGDADVHAAYLPFAFVFERMLQYCLILTGGQLGFTSGGSDERLFDDLAVIQPTVLIAVPRLVALLHEKVALQRRSSSAMSAKAWAQAYEAKRDALHRGHYHNMMYDQPVFGWVKNKLGGRVRIVVLGGAPIDPQLLEFMRIAVAPVVQGYGMTETTGVIALARLEHTASLSVGVPLPCNELRLVSRPELGYSVTDIPHARGEICVRGPNVSESAAVSGDGWFATGDIGKIVDGALHIIDRKSNILKLGNGEFVSIEQIEGIYQLDAFVKQAYACVHRGVLACVVVLDMVALEKFTQELSADFGDIGLDDAAHMQKALPRDFMDKRLRDTALAKGLPAAHHASVFHYEAAPWTPANLGLTANYKINRTHLHEKYATVIEELVRARA